MERGKYQTLLVGMQTGAITMANRKLKTELQCDPAIPLLGIYLKKRKTVTQKDICILMFTAASFTIADMEAT